MERGGGYMGPLGLYKAKGGYMEPGGVTWAQGSVIWRCWGPGGCYMEVPVPRHVLYEGSEAQGGVIGGF